MSIVLNYLNLSICIGSYLGEKEDRPFLSNIDMVSLAYQVALGMDHLASKKV